jgi:thiamine-monophosphate kinase
VQDANPQTDELTLIERIRRALPAPTPARRDLLLGIGDDAAVLRLPALRHLVITCDAFLENAHFLAEVHPPESVGYKSLARATSDLAAMGARPLYFLLALALPSSRSGAWLDRFLAGMARAAREFDLIIAGGDTSRSASIAVNITVLGEIAPGGAVARSGARPGHLIYASGTLGAAQLGLELILRGYHRRPRWRRLLTPHLYPKIRLSLGAWLAKNRIAAAMIDTSDGLSTDLGHLCRASHAGARIFAGRLPAVRVPQALRSRGFDPLELALHGGEDYELLFAVPRRLALRVPRAYGGVPIACIGEFTRDTRIVLAHSDGHTTPLTPHGWDHFRGR